MVYRQVQRPQQDDINQSQVDKHINRERGPGKALPHYPDIQQAARSAARLGPRKS